MSRCVSASERWGYITAASRDCLGSECQSTDRFICVSPSCGINHLLSFRTPDVIVGGLRAFEILDQDISWKHIRVSSGYRSLHSPDEIGLGPSLLGWCGPICASYIRRYSQARVSNSLSFTFSALSHNRNVANRRTRQSSTVVGVRQSPASNPSPSSRTSLAWNLSLLAFMGLADWLHRIDVVAKARFVTDHCSLV
jgi:hypothetical protein